MKNRGISILIYAVIGLAVIGLVTQLFGNTTAFLTRIVFMVGMAALFLAAFYFVFVKKRTSSDESKKYKQAVKQSAQKHSPSQTGSYQSAQRKQQSANKQKQKRSSKKRASHLKVIDGNKSKSKDKKRASN